MSAPALAAREAFSAMLKPVFSVMLGLAVLALLSPSLAAAQDEPHIDEQAGTLASEAPEGILYPGEKPGFILVVFKAIQQLHIYRHDGEGNLYLVRVLPCSTGMAHGDKLVRGDKKTPEGYYIFRQKLLPTEVPDIYGILAYPMDYPNFWDRSIGRGGDGIWTHGINKPLVDYDSEGCIELLNHDLAELEPYIKLYETPILVLEDLKVADVNSLKAEGQRVVDFVESWRKAWTEKDLVAYAGMYEQGFANSDSLSYQSWMDKKRRLAQAYQRIEVGIENLRVYRHRDTIVASFNQVYKGDNRFTSIGLKRLYLRDDGAGSYFIAAEEFTPPPGKPPNKWLTASQRDWAINTPPLAVAQIAQPVAAASAGVLMPPEITVASAVIARTADDGEAEAAAEETARAAIESRSMEKISGEAVLADLSPMANPELAEDPPEAENNDGIIETDIVATNTPANDDDLAAKAPVAIAKAETETLAAEAETAPAKSEALAAKAELGGAKTGAPGAGSSASETEDAPNKSSPASKDAQPKTAAPSQDSKIVTVTGLIGSGSGSMPVPASSSQPSQDVKTVATIAALKTRDGAPSSDASPQGQAQAAAASLDKRSATDFLDQWVQSWSEQDRDAYFSLYAPDFYFPDKKLHLPAFRRYRGGHMARAAFVKIGVSDVDVALKGSKAVVTFTQTYESDRNKDRGRKTLELTEHDGRWLITSETFQPQS